MRVSDVEADEEGRVDGTLSDPEFEVVAAGTKNELARGEGGWDRYPSVGLRDVEYEDVSGMEA